MSPEITRIRMQLSPIAYDRRMYTLLKTHHTLKDSYIYNFETMGGIKEDEYDVNYEGGSVYLPTQRDMKTKSPLDSPLSI